MERFGYPEYLLASTDDLISGQYADRPHLRPILAALLAAAATAGDITVQARTTYVSLVSPRRQFALVRATIRTRVDLGLRLEGVPLGGRLVEAHGLGNDTISARRALRRWTRRTPRSRSGSAARAG
jgi:Domain of unknown function (DUF5655)